MAKIQFSVSSSSSAMYFDFRWFIPLMFAKRNLSVGVGVIVGPVSVREGGALSSAVGILSSVLEDGYPCRSHGLSAPCILSLGNLFRLGSLSGASLIWRSPPCSLPVDFLGHLVFFS